MSTTVKRKKSIQLSLSWPTTLWDGHPDISLRLRLGVSPRGVCLRESWLYETSGWYFPFEGGGVWIVLFPKVIPSERDVSRILLLIVVWLCLIISILHWEILKSRIQIGIHTRNPKTDFSADKSVLGLPFFPSFGKSENGLVIKISDLALAHTYWHPKDHCSKEQFCKSFYGFPNQTVQKEI